MPKLNSIFTWLADRRMLGLSWSWQFGGGDNGKKSMRWIFQNRFKEKTNDRYTDGLERARADANRTA